MPDSNTSPLLFVLGASDPEMSAIETLIREAGALAIYAVDDDGQRVTPRSAYSAARTSDDAALHRACTGQLVYTVECGPGPNASWAWLRTGLVPGRETESDCSALVLRIDHHRPGDPGYGQPSANYLCASSIGQVWLALGRDLADMPADLRMVAAADHCLGAAYRGGCPGIDADALLDWRISSRAAWQRRSATDIRRDIEAARAALRGAEDLVLHTRTIAYDRFGQDASWSGYPGVCWEDDETRVKDMRRETPIPELVEAAMIEGASYVSGPLIDPRDPGRAKYTVSGHEHEVRAWTEYWAPAHGLVDVYGDPARGFAGGYVLITQATNDP